MRNLQDPRHQLSIGVQEERLPQALQTFALREVPRRVRGLRGDGLQKRLSFVQSEGLQESLLVQRRFKLRRFNLLPPRRLSPRTSPQRFRSLPNPRRLQNLKFVAAWWAEASMRSKVARELPQTLR